MHSYQLCTNPPLKIVPKGPTHVGFVLFIGCIDTKKDIEWRRPYPLNWRILCNIFLFVIIWQQGRGGNRRNETTEPSGADMLPSSGLCVTEATRFFKCVNQFFSLTLTALDCLSAWKLQWWLQVNRQIVKISPPLGDHSQKKITCKMKAVPTNAIIHGLSL